MRAMLNAGLPFQETAAHNQAHAFGGRRFLRRHSSIIASKEAATMFNFEFYNPTRIVFGMIGLKELERLIPAAARVLVLYGGGSVKKFGTRTRCCNLWATGRCSNLAASKPTRAIPP